MGGIAVATMMAVQGRDQPGNFRRYARWHKWCGWLFLLLFALMFILMLERVENYWEETSPRIALHVTFAIALVLLLVLKVLIPRSFPKLNRYLFILGITVYLSGFTMVWITAGYYLIWRYEEAPYIYHGELPAHMLDVELGKQLFITKCSTCHLLENIMQIRSVESWERVVNRMVELATPRIAPGEGVQILHFLTQTHVPVAGPETGSPLAQYCLPCHKASEIMRESYSRRGWREVVMEMREYGPDIIPADRIDEIVDFLVNNQQGQ
jgi:cytochrome c2